VVIVRIDTLPGAGGTFTLQRTPDEIRADWGERAWPAGGEVGPADAQVHLVRAFGGVDLKGHVELAWALPCDRCLTEVTGSAAEDVAVRFERGRGEVVDEHELTESEFAVEEFDGQAIDLGEWLDGQAALMLPDQVLCRPDCPGLCPQCGARRADGDCGCRESGDPGWAALRGLKV
jgi:uncharacterized protein